MDYQVFLPTHEFKAHSVALLERIDTVKEEYDKLNTENKLLQEWIGNSIQRNSKAKPRS
jgi:hypothetical protein